MSQIAEKLIKKFSTIKTLPHVVTRLSLLIHDENSTMREFEDIIKMDPTLVARLLSLVNSPYYGLAQKVDSIGRAVAYIGMKDLYNLTVTDAMKNMFTSSDVTVENYSRKGLWLHCAAVSICCKIVAERIFGVNGDNPYLAGIIHDFGIIIEEQVQPDQFFAACRATTQEGGSLDSFEEEFLNTNHSEIGYILAKQWNIAEEIQEAIRDHHTLIEGIKPESLTGILQISEYLSAQMGYEAMPGFSPSLSPCLADHIHENIDEYKILIEDLPEEMDKAKALYGS